MKNKPLKGKEKNAGRPVDGEPSPDRKPRQTEAGATFHDPEQKSKQVPEDMVDEEGMESFPASDPPGHHQSHA